MNTIVAAIVGFVVLLVFSALFSGSETAFFSLSRLELAEMDKKSLVSRLMRDPQRLLILILLGNTLVNVAAGALGAFAALRISRLMNYPEALTIALEVGVVTLVILVLGEMAPKMYAIQRNVVAAVRSAPVLYGASRVFSPVVLALDSIVAKMNARLGESESPLVTEEELKTILAVSTQEGMLEEGERDMIGSVMEFGDTVAREVMVPRVDMECLENTMGVSEAVEKVKALGLSRLPVFHNDIDHIVGILYAKDLLRSDSDAGHDRPIDQIVRRVHFTPESKNAGELLRELQRDRTHIAIVVDEYGGTAGLVTLEDLIEEIVGEIRDEHDDEEPLVQVMNKSTIIADGMIPIDDLSEQLGVEFEGEGFETLGGYLLNAFGRIPSEGEKFERGGLEFLIEDVDELRIKTVRIHQESSTPSDDDDGGRET